MFTACHDWNSWTGIVTNAHIFFSVSGLLEDEGRKTRLFSVRAIRGLLLLAPAGSLPVQLLHNAATGNARPGNTRTELM